MRLSTGIIDTFLLRDPRLVLMDGCRDFSMSSNCSWTGDQTVWLSKAKVPTRDAQGSLSHMKGEEADKKLDSRHTVAVLGG